MSARAPKRVLLIGWDAADWQMIDPLIERGEMPHMQRFLEGGVRGNIATLSPPLSPMLWTSIATGKTADKHGILGFAEPDGTSGRSRPVTSAGRTCKALWNILTDHGRPSGAINWYASHPCEHINGFVVSDRFAHPVGPLDEREPMLGWPTVPGSVWPEEDLAPLAATRVHPQMITHEQVLEFIPGAAGDESAGWEKVRELRVLLAHCATVHNAATACLADRDWDFCGVYYDAIDRFAHAFMEFHPPKMAHVTEKDFALYRGVMEACYRLHDLMLGRLMNLVDDETAVIIVSDHGFHCGATRPRGTSGITDGRPAAWHRPYGVVAMRGPGIKRGEPIYGATLLDIAPTVLTMLGLPPARDMDGIPLTQIWHEPRLCAQRVETYETGEPAGAHERPVSQADTDEQIMRQLRQLGYLGADDAQSVSADRAKNLGVVYLSTGRSRQALEQFQRVLEIRPGSERMTLMIAMCLMNLGRLAEARELIGRGSAPGGELDAGRLQLLATLSARQGDHAQALTRLQAARANDPSLVGIDTRLGRAHARLGDWACAEDAYERALAIDPDDADALDGLGVVYQRTGRPQEAVLAHTRSIALLRNNARAHTNLGDALMRAGRRAWAVEAFSEAARIAPWDPRPHRRLSVLYGKILGDDRKGAFHRVRARQVRVQRLDALRQMQQMPMRIAGSHGEEPGDDRAASTEAPGVVATSHAPARGGITLVSGLPRSGTSLMMRMLEAGGVEPLTDGVRGADASNPRGYYELEAVKNTAVDPSWVARAPGRAVKVIHALLRVLPDDHRYSVIFMKRRLDEVVASQGAMLGHIGRGGADLTNRALHAAYAREYERAGAWLSTRSNFRVLEVSYNDLMREPVPVIEAIAVFLGRELDADAMRGVIDPELYRQRC